jgi:hypothetical protein
VVNGVPPPPTFISKNPQDFLNLISGLIKNAVSIFAFRLLSSFVATCALQMTPCLQQARQTEGSSVQLQEKSREKDAILFAKARQSFWT